MTCGPLLVLLLQASQILQVAWAMVALSDREFALALLAYTNNIEYNIITSEEYVMMIIRALMIFP